jgi:tripartite ATP-independent transporter DctM subunit
MSPIITGVIGIIVLVAIMLLNIPIGVAMALVGFVGFSVLVSVEAALNVLAKDIFTVLSTYTYTVIPLFILMGQLLVSAGISRKLYNTAYKWLGHLPGGLAIASIMACALFGAVSGSSLAGAATIGTVAIPEMRKHQYDPALACGCVAAGGTLAALIPPSLIFIVYGIMVERSIGKLFIAGVFPGILLASLMMLTIYIMARRNPKLAPPGTRSSWIERLKSFTGVTETLLLFLLVLGGLFAGLFTPTEAAAVGTFGALLIGLIERKFTWQGITTAFSEALRNSCMILVILVGAMVFGHFLAVTKIPLFLADYIVTLEVPKTVVLVFIAVVYLIGGCFMEALPLVLLTIPIFIPLCITLGFDLIWFGVLICLLGQIGLITPPVGLCVYVIKGVAPDVPIGTIFRGVIPFVIVMILCLIILIAFPQISLFLPSFMTY